MDFSNSHVSSLYSNFLGLLGILGRAKEPGLDELALLFPSDEGDVVFPVTPSNPCRFLEYSIISFLFARVLISLLAISDTNDQAINGIPS